MQELINKFSKILMEEKVRKDFYIKSLVILFGCVSLFMTAVNMITVTYPLGYVTFGFTVFCVLDYVLLRENDVCKKIGTILLLIVIYAMLVYFIITGGTDNFSIQWVLILPPVAVTFIGLKTGIIFSAIMFVTLAAFMYLPGLNALITDYGTTFCLRFPMVYVAVALMSILVEYTRELAERKMIETRKEYEHLYVHDELTNLGNRYMMDEDIKKLSKSDAPAAMAMFDIDNFKKFNDTYGHSIGDVVLRDVGGIVMDTLPESATVYRWGGEEFIMLFRDISVAEEYSTKVLENVRNHRFVFNNEPVQVTISIGLCISDKPAKTIDFDKLLIEADNKLYEAKDSGRNNVKVVHY